MQPLSQPSLQLQLASIANSDWLENLSSPSVADYFHQLISSQPKLQLLQCLSLIRVNKIQQRLKQFLQMLFQSLVQIEPQDLLMLLRLNGWLQNYITHWKQNEGWEIMLQYFYNASSSKE